MRVKSHHVAVSLFIGAIVLGSVTWLGLPAGAVATCGSGTAISMVSPTATTISGSQTLAASTSGSTVQPTGVSFMITAPNQMPLGDVTSASGGSNNTWSLSWDSRSVPDGTYQFAAVAHYASGSAYDCLSNALPINVLNSSATATQNPTLVVSISPDPWQGLPGQSQTFAVNGVYTDQFGKQYPVAPSNGATYSWFTNAGTLSPNGTPTTTLTDGPATGNFDLGVAVTMNGITAKPSAKVSIVSSTATSGSSSAGPSPTPVPTTTVATNDDSTTTNLSPQEAATLASTPTIFRPRDPTNSNPVVPVQTLGCLEQKLGSKFKEISSGEAQASTDDRLKGSVCFSGSAKIPATLAPVEPAHVAELPTNTDIVKVTDLKNETITSKSGNKVTAIVLNGTGTPNTSIFLFVFSDPMVLRAQTDSAGKWSYVLENPLKPGHHEIYAVSQKDAGNFVRTPAVPVAIAAASPGSQDGSLIIEHSLQPIQIAYIAGAVLMILAGVFLILRLRHRTHPAPSAPATLVQPAATAAAPAPAPAPTPPDSHDAQT